MHVTTLLSWIALLIGEGILIASFLLWRGNAPDNIWIMNLIVSSVVYASMFVDILMPWVNFKDKSQKQVASIGLRWVVTSIYAIAAIALMLAGNLWLMLSFELQLIIHCILLVLLVLGIVGVLQVSTHTKHLYLQDQSLRQGIGHMRQAIADLKNSMCEYGELPNEFISRINALQEELRYLSPSNNPEANSLEAQFIDCLKSIAINLPNYSLNQRQIEGYLCKAEQIYQNRKSLYSN